MVPNENHDRIISTFWCKYPRDLTCGCGCFILCFSQLLYFTHNVREWLDRDPKNVIAVHCKGGKGESNLQLQHSFNAK